MSLVSPLRLTLNLHGFSRVSELMLLEGGRLGECSLTHITLEWLFTCVNTLMLFEGGKPGKFTLACVTLVRLFPCVIALMRF